MAGVLVEPRRQLRRVRGGGGGRPAEAADVAHRKRHGSRVDAGREEYRVQLGARARGVSQCRDALGSAARRRHGTASAHRLGRLRELLAGRHEDGVHAASRGLVAATLSGRLRGGPVGDGRARDRRDEEVHEAGRRGLQGQLSVADVRARRDLFRGGPCGG